MSTVPAGRHGDHLADRSPGVGQCGRGGDLGWNLQGGDVVGAHGHACGQRTTRDHHGV
nr:hypothetical protein [Propionibacterium freudenreichii]